MDERLRQQIRNRAGNHCEYCQISRHADQLPFQVDHIIGEFHHGTTTLNNLAWSCFDCNVYKGTNLAGIDPLTQELMPLVHPRSDDWDEHFEWHGSILIGKTKRGRATIDVLRINLPSRVEHRRLLVLLGDMQ